MAFDRQMLQDFLALPDEERAAVIGAPNAPPVLKDFAALPASEQQTVLGGPPTSAPARAVTAESLKHEVGSFNPLSTFGEFLRGEGSKLATIGRTAVSDPSRVLSATGKALYGMTLGPLEEAGKQLHGLTPFERRRAEIARGALPITQREQGYTGLLTPTEEELGATQGAALMASFLGKGGNLRVRTGPTELRPLAPRPLLALPPAQPLPVTPEGRVVTPRIINERIINETLDLGMTPQEIAAAQKRLNVPVRRGKTERSRITVTTEPHPPPPPNVAPVVYSGFQEGFGGKPGFHLYTLTEDLSPTLVKGSTVNARTLRQAGFEVPPPPTPLQPKAPQVEHGELLAGLKKPDAEPPRLPLSEEPKGTVEFGMGLPIPQAMKDRLRRFLASGEQLGAKGPQATPILTRPPGISEGQWIRMQRRPATTTPPPLEPPTPSMGSVASPLSSTPFQQAQQQVIDALKAAKPIRAETERLYSQERSKRLAAALEAGHAIPGREGYYAQLGALKGELPKGTFEPLALNEETVKKLFTGVRESKALSGFDQITAQRGLAKLLGDYGGVVPTKGELELLGRVFPPEFIQAVAKKRGLLPRLMDAAAEGLAIPKALMASMDLSATLRQGFTAIAPFPRQWGRAVMEQFRYFGSERAYEAMIREIETRPTFDKMRQAKLSLSAVDGMLLTGREEQFMSTLPERIPVIGHMVRASDRAYTGFLTKLRADAFEEMLRRGKQAGIEETDRFMADAAKYINTATGRGSLGQFEAAGSALSTAFFSPRLMASRFNLLNPMFYVKLDPLVRRQALRGALGTVALGATVLGLAKAGGAKVGTDPRNADFGKIRVGNTRWDVWAGLSHFPRIAAQLISGEVVSSTTGKTLTLGKGYKPLTRKDIIQRFFENKANPIIGFTLRMLEGRGFDGKPISVSKEVRDLFVPMVVQDLSDMYHEDPTLLPWATPIVFGVGVQTYGPKGR